ncbi:hypothetical protein [Sporomusa ovata]|nr:hypothetical protein [Sporomusa ovata]
MEKFALYSEIPASFSLFKKNIIINFCRSRAVKENVPLCTGKEGTNK